MTWNELTVWQYQQIYPIVTKPEKDWTTLDVESKLVGIIFNLTDTQVDSLSVKQFNNLKATLDFLDDKIEGKPVKYTEVNGKRYKFIYDVQQIKAARYIETKVFSTDLVGNLHKLAASMVMPQRKTWYGKWVDDTYDAAKHSQYAEDLQGANFMHVYQSIVFFYQVYRNWIEVSQGYLVQEMTNKGMSLEQAKEVVLILCSTLDGNIAPNLLPTTKISQLTKAMNLPQYNS
jgi:hypothetical protein